MNKTKNTLEKTEEEKSIIEKYKQIKSIIDKIVEIELHYIKTNIR